MQNVKRWVKQLYTMEIVADDVLEKLLVPETIRLMQMFAPPLQKVWGQYGVKTILVCDCVGACVQLYCVFVDSARQHEIVPTWSEVVSGSLCLSMKGTVPM